MIQAEFSAQVDVLEVSECDDWKLHSLEEAAKYR
jgi:hypothetical protein